MQHQLKLSLVDADGNAVMLAQTPMGEPAPLEVTADFEVGRPPGLPHGTSIDQALPINIGAGLPLIPGQMYQWRVSINGKDLAARSFLVRKVQAPPAILRATVDHVAAYDDPASSQDADVAASYDESS